MRGKFHEKFNDPLKAVCYVGMGVGKEFPSGVLEVTYKAGMRLRQQSCRVCEVVRVLEQMCRHFRWASVYYDPSSPDGNIAELHCHCEEHMKLNCCHHKEDRPRILLRLIQADTGQTTQESTSAVVSQSHSTPSSVRDNWR